MSEYMHALLFWNGFLAVVAIVGYLCYRYLGGDTCAYIVVGLVGTFIVFGIPWSMSKGY